MSRLAGNKEAKKYMDELGVSMYNAKGQLLPFKDQLSLLTVALAELSEEARNVKLSEIAGEEGKASLIVLMNELAKFDDKVAQLRDSFGLAHKKAMEMQNTLIGSYKELKSALEGLAIKIGQDLSPALRQVIEDATVFIQNLDNDEIKKFGDSIANVIETLGELGGLFIQIAGFAGEVLGKFEELTGVSSGVAVGLGVIAFKMRGLLVLMKGFSPVSLILTTAIMAVYGALKQWEAEIERTNTATTKFIKTAGKLGTVIEDIVNASDQLDLTGIKEYMAFIGIKDAEGQIRNYNKLIKNLETGWVSDADKAQVIAYKEAIFQLNGIIDNSRVGLKKLTELGQKLTDQQRKDLELTNKRSEAKKKLAEEMKAVSEAMKTELDALKTRESALEKTLGTMATKERKYQRDLIKLSNDLAKIRKKHADARLQLIADHETKIADLKVKGLSDILVYNDAQKRADEQLAKAKKAIAEGNLVMAKKYLDEYDRLTAISAGEEISHEKEIQVWDAKTKKYKTETIKVVDALRATTLAEALKDEANGHALRMQLGDMEKVSAIEAHNEKIAQKIAEIKMIKAQMTLQQSMLNQIGEMIAMAKGVVFEADMTAFTEAMGVADTQIKKLMSQQREIKITGNVDGVKDEVDGLDKDIKRDPIEADLELDTEVGFTEFKKFKNNAERTPLELNAEVDLVEPKDDVKAFKHDVESDEIVAPVTSDTSQAIRNDTAMRRRLSRPLPTLTQYIQQIIIPARQNGGLIFTTPSMPKFADGGHLENGNGHSRKSGKLGGYGGGDKIKALLEAGEFIIRKEAVRALGLDRLHTLNQGQMPKYQHGGMVSPIQKFNTGGTVQPNQVVKSGQTVDLNFNLGGQTFKAQTSDTIAIQLAEYLQRSEF